MADAPYRWQGDTLILNLQVQPRASRNEFAGVHGTRLRLRLTAPPVDGAANAALLRFLAGTFGVAKSKVSLLKGTAGRAKQVSIAAPRKLPPFISPP
ncbi:MAG TPA: YggU family protein [Gammaproteobacteria bacterium]|nr:YggU family protein [Gammaproteobacteria bacterium]